MAKHNLTPLARLVSYNAAGCDPHIMGIGPVYAVNNALKRAGLQLSDMDLCEVPIKGEVFSQTWNFIELHRQIQ